MMSVANELGPSGRVDGGLKWPRVSITTRNIVNDLIIKPGRGYGYGYLMIVTTYYRCY